MGSEERDGFAMISITGLGQRFANALGLPGQVAVRKLIDDLVELPAGIPLASSGRERAAGIARTSSLAGRVGT